MNLLGPLASVGRSFTLQFREESLEHQVHGENLRIHNSWAHSEHCISGVKLGLQIDGMSTPAAACLLNAFESFRDVLYCID
jgi:hypothetical protein